MKYFSLFLIVFLKIQTIYSQDTLTSEGFFQMELPQNFDKNKIEKECIQNAKLEAIEKAFGSVLTQKNTNSLSNTIGNGEVKTQQMFSSNSFSYLSGKWISDINPPVIEYFNYKKTEWISAKVSGYVKQLSIDEISKNPSTPNDFLALAFSSKNLGNDRKSIEYLEKYFELTTDNFFEPHQIYIDLMDSEDRLEEAVKFYENKYDKDSSVFSLLMLTLAKKDELSLIDISNKYPTSALGKILMIKTSIKNNVIMKNISMENYCERLEIAENLNEFINSKYYKNTKDFLSQNTAKNIFNDIEKITLMNLSNLRNDYIKDKMVELINKSKTIYNTKDDIVNDVVKNLNDDFMFKCSNKETLIKFINKYYKE